MNNDNKFVFLMDCADINEVQVVKSYLTALGFHPRIKDEYTRTVAPHYTNLLGNLSIEVPENEFIQASKIIEELSDTNILRESSRPPPCALNHFFVEEARLKSHIGCVYDGETPALIENLYAGEIPAGQYVQAVFTGSPGIGPLKVYPHVNEYMQKSRLKQNGALVEIYKIHSISENNAMTTTYLFPAVML